MLAQVSASGRRYEFGMVKPIKKICLLAGLMVPAFYFTACKAKPGVRGSSIESNRNNNVNGISLVSGEYRPGSSKAVLYAAMRDKATVVAFCPDTIKQCSQREIASFPGRETAGAPGSIIFASVVEFDLKETPKFSVFVRMAGGGLACGDFASESSSLGQVIVAAGDGVPTLCAGSDPTTLANSSLRELLLSPSAESGQSKDSAANGKAATASNWIPNPEAFALADEESKIIRQTNEIRATAGLPPFIVSSQLMLSARSWAQSAASRMAANEHSRLGVSENACCSPPGPFSVQEIIAIWQYSPDAKEKILARDMRYIGVGNAVDAYGNKYWYQQFL